MSGARLGSQAKNLSVCLQIFSNLCHHCVASNLSLMHLNIFSSIPPEVFETNHNKISIWRGKELAGKEKEQAKRQGEGEGEGSLKFAQDFCPSDGRSASLDSSAIDE